MYFGIARNKKTDIERWNTNVVYAWMKKENVYTELEWFEAAISLIQDRYMATS
jgi:hypothetical protein